MPDPCRPFNLERGATGVHPARAAHPRAAFIESGIASGIHMEGAVGFAEAQGIGLLIQAVRCNRKRRGTARRIHALELEACRVERGEHGVAAAGLTADRGALDDLGHVHDMAHVKAQHFRDAGEDGGIAGPARDDHVGIESERAFKGLAAHLRHQEIGRAHV